MQPMILERVCVTNDFRERVCVINDFRECVINNFREI